jgi:hypothetical protein
VAWFGAREVVAVPIPDGALAVTLRGTDEARFTLPLAAGRWRAAVEPTDAPLTVRAVDAPTNDANAAFVLADDGDVTLELRADGEGPRARRVVLTRLPD